MRNYDSLFGFALLASRFVLFSFAQNPRWPNSYQNIKLAPIKVAKLNLVAKAHLVFMCVGDTFLRENKAGAKIMITLAGPNPVSQ